MKTKLILVLLLILSLEFSSRADEKWWVQGKVVSVVEKGIIVHVIRCSAVGMQQPENSAAVFLLGKFNIVDYEPIAVTAIPSGTYRYTAASSAGRTIRAFQVISVGHPLPPMAFK